MNGIVNELANENACHSEVTWYLDRWIPGIMIRNVQGVAKDVLLYCQEQY